MEYPLAIYDPQLGGLWKKVKKGLKKIGKGISRAFTVPKPIRRKIRRAKKDIRHAVKRAVTVPHKVRKAFTEYGLMDAFEVWIDTELEPGIEKFAEGRTLITPVDVILAPLSLFVPGAGQIAGQAAMAGAKAAGAVGWKAAAMGALKTAAINAIPEAFSTAIETGMSLDEANRQTRELEKLAKRAGEREEAELRIADIEFAREEAAFSAAMEREAGLRVVPEAQLIQPVLPFEKKNHFHGNTPFSELVCF